MPDQLWRALLAGAALLLGSCRDLVGVSSGSHSTQSPSSSSSVPGKGRGVSGGESLNWLSHRNGKNYDNGHDYFNEGVNTVHTIPKHQEALSYGNSTSTISHNSSSDAGTLRVPDIVIGGEGQGTNNGETTLVCAYRVMESGGKDRLCFRDTQRGFVCRSGECQKVRSEGGRVVANVLANGSVLIQWGQERELGMERSIKEKMTIVPRSEEEQRAVKEPKIMEKSQNRAQKTVQRKTVEEKKDGKGLPTSHLAMSGTENMVQRGGFGLSCWWNGSYTQFECAGVQLGASCRDYLLSELHENVPYRICVRPLFLRNKGGHGDDPGECVEFTVSPSRMQDIVIAMTTVGGAICVMLVIICLLVAYITENIMSPTTQHVHTAQHTHRTHSHLSQL